MQIKNCRICKSQDLHKFLVLGHHPPSDAFLKEEQLNSPETTYPLDVFFCNNCRLVQLGYVVPPEILFPPDYPYTSSVSDTMPVHFAEFVKEAVERFGLNSNALVVDIGSNDGTLLRGFRNLGVRTLGVEPATNISKIATSRGIETINAFWSKEIVNKIIQEKGKAKIITGTNVFAHVNDLDDFLLGVKTLLDDDGVLIVEFPYLVDLIEKIEFDTIYHEHLSYFSVWPLVILFKRFDLEIFDVKRVPVHGGSIRIFVKRSSAEWPVTNSVKSLIDLENQMKFDIFETYTIFTEKVNSLRKELLNLLKELKDQGKKIAGYGAPAKGNTLLNYCKIGTDIIEFIVDKSPLKQGLYTPGMHIPVFPVEKLLKDIPDYMLIFPWNFKEEIMKQQEKFKESGGKFIIPVPQPRII